MTKQDLSSLRYLRAQIETTEERILRLKSMAERFTKPLSYTKARPAPRDELAEYAAKLDELERQLASRVIALEEKIDYIERGIARLPEQQAVIMRLRYVEGLKWEQVAQKTHYSCRHCTKIHAAAIERLPKTVRQAGWENA